MYKLCSVYCTILTFMYRRIVRVENFKQQVVAGTKYTFNLVLASHKDNVSFLVYLILLNEQLIIKWLIRRKQLTLSIVLFLASDWVVSSRQPSLVEFF